MASLLHLGKKYGFRRISDEVIQQLRQIVPKSVQEWADLPREFSNATDLFRLTKTVLDLGHENLLPGLFLLCSMCFNDATVSHPQAGLIFEFNR